MLNWIHICLIIFLTGNALEQLKCYDKALEELKAADKILPNKPGIQKTIEKLTDLMDNDVSDSDNDE